MKTKTLVILVIAILATINLLSNNLEEGIIHYNNRAEVYSELKADQTNINKAIACFKKALNENELEASIYLLKSYYFKTTFTEVTDSEKEALLNFAHTFGTKQMNKFPESVDLLYYYTINYGKRAELIGIMKAAKEGVAGEMKRLAERLIELDPEYKGGKGQMILGILHLRTPWIIRWADNDEAKRLIEESLELNPNNFSSNLYYAEVLIEEGEEEKAVSILEKLITKLPSTDSLLEDSREIAEAKNLLLACK